jgi:SAM-dependent methyltransferase
MSSGIAMASNYHRYLFRHLEPFLGNRVLEIGCGYGQYTELLLKTGRMVLATDIDISLTQMLEKRLLPDWEGKLATNQIDLYSPPSISRCLEWQPNSIICMNVLEHIEKDKEALAELSNGSRGELTVAFLCPAHQFLFGFMDSEAGHFRRYSRNSFKKLFTSAGWQVRKCFYINPIGAIGWWVRNKLLPPSGRSLDDPAINSDIAFFDKYVLPFSQRVEPLTSRLFGQSVIVIASSHKKSHNCRKFTNPLVTN